MLNELKNFAVQRCGIEELVELSSFGRTLVTEFEALGVEVPEWITENLASIRREIKTKNAERLAAKVKSIRTRLEALATPDERKAKLQQELDQLEKLAGAASA